jgi:outer membrane protein assembly factor BamC
MYSTGERNRFRTRLERGVEPGTTEIYVSHRAMEEVYTSLQQEQTRWQPRGSDRDLEAEMLGRMLVKLGSPQAQAAVAARPAPAAPGSKPAPAGAAPIATTASANASLENAGAGPLVVNDGFERAWRRVGLALDRVSFTVEDRDRSKGTFFVRYIDPDADAADTEGLMGKLAFWKPSPKAPQPQFRIQLSDGGAGLTQVVVQNVKGEPENSPTSRRILALLFEQLK